jgi:hypothetical protein
MPSGLWGKHSRPFELTRRVTCLAESVSVDYGDSSFLKVLLDHFEPNLYISNNNPVFEPVYTVCIKRDLCPGDNRYSIEI